MHYYAVRRRSLWLSAFLQILEEEVEERVRLVAKRVLFEW
jgi:hypothetical protein